MRPSAVYVSFRWLKGGKRFQFIQSGSGCPRWACAMAEPAKKRIKVSHGELTKEFDIKEGSLDQNNWSWIAREFGLPPVGLKVQPDGTDTGVRLIFEGVTDNAEYTIAGAALQKEVGSSVFACRCLSIPETYDSRKKFLSVCDAVKGWLLTR